MVVVWSLRRRAGRAPPGSSRRRSGATPSDPERPYANPSAPTRSDTIPAIRSAAAPGILESLRHRREPAIKCNQSAIDEGDYLSCVRISPGVADLQPICKFGPTAVTRRQVLVSAGGCANVCEAYFRSALLESTPNGRTHLSRARAQKFPAQNDVVLRRSRAIERQPRKTRESAAAVA